MSQMKPNPNIRCRVSSCAYNCGDKECCSLQAIQVEPCGDGDKRSKAEMSMCDSYRRD